jgi:3,4-dihydroxy 2-butanone 4-phosphate synthase/GTP cyclohydrolase II
MLGHQADGRDYTAAAHILHDLGIRSVQLLTNNPDKIAGLQAAGIPVAARLPLATAVTPENAAYLKTKVEKMRHLLDLEIAPAANGAERPSTSRPFVTLSYAQSVDGSIAIGRGQPTPLSGPEALRMTHRLRASHDAILVGIGTLLADDPRLTVRLVEGEQPQPVVIDGRLRFPLSAQLLQHPKRPLIITTSQVDESRQRALEVAGAEVVRVTAAPDGRVSLAAALAVLQMRGVGSLMVEGGAQIITSFLAAQLIDRLVITIVPRLLGGLPAVAYLNGHGSPRLFNTQYHQLGADIVLASDVGWR